MKRLMLAACLLAILSTIAFAAPKPADKVEPDPGLDQKVTIRAVGKPLGDFLKEISAQTGVKMTAKKDAADIKVVVLVKDTPLSSLKDALKDCLHLQCTREGKQNEWTYNFWEDMKTRQEAEGIRQEQVKKLRTHVEKLVKQIAEIEDEGTDPAALKAWVDALTPEEQEKLAHGNPDRYAAYSAFQSPGTLAALTAYSGLSRTQLQELWTEKPVTVLAEEMPPDLRKKFLAGTQSWNDEMRKMGWRFGDQDDTVPDTANCITLSITDSEWDNKPRLDYVLAVAIAGKSGSGLASIGGSCISSPPDTEEPDAPPSGVTAAGPDTRPDLKLKITPKTTLYDVMEQVFNLTGTCMIADYYTRMIQPGVISGVLGGSHPPFKTADDVLRQSAKDTRSDLANTGDVRILSSKSWPADRDREIPERLLAKWRAVRKQYGGLRIQEALEMSGLSKLQLEDLELYKTGYGWAVLIHQPAIKVAGSLTTKQWQAAMSEAGLSTSEMSDAQLALVRGWVQGSEGDPYNRPLGLSEELSDPQRLRSCVFKIKYKGRGEKDDDIKAAWEFELYPPSYYEAIRKGASDAAAKGEETFAVPAPECRGYLSLSDLNQARGWPAPEDTKDAEDTSI